MPQHLARPHPARLAEAQAAVKACSPQRPRGSEKATQEKRLVEKPARFNCSLPRIEATPPRATQQLAQGRPTSHTRPHASPPNFPPPNSPCLCGSVVNVFAFLVDVERLCSQSQAPNNQIVQIVYVVLTNTWQTGQFAWWVFPRTLRRLPQLWIHWSASAIDPANPLPYVQPPQPISSSRSRRRGWCDAPVRRPRDGCRQPVERSVP